MSKRYKIEEIGTLNECAARLGVKGLRVHRVTRHKDSFPEPIGKIGNAPVYAFEDVKAWYLGLRPKAR